MIGGVGNDINVFGFTRTLKSKVVEFTYLSGKANSLGELYIRVSQRVLLDGRA